MAHLSCDFHVSPFKESVVLSVDGFGDFSSGARGVGCGSQILIDGRIFPPNSLGLGQRQLKLSGNDNKNFRISTVGFC